MCPLAVCEETHGKTNQQYDQTDLQQHAEEADAAAETVTEHHAQKTAGDQATDHRPTEAAEKAWTLRRAERRLRRRLLLRPLRHRPVDRGSLRRRRSRYGWGIEGARSAASEAAGSSSACIGSVKGR